MPKYKIVLNIETKRDIKFPEEAQLLEELESHVYSNLDGYVEFEPSTFVHVQETVLCGPGDDHCCSGGISGFGKVYCRNHGG